MNTTRRTQAKNATAHPGAIVLAAQGKRWTKAQKQADDNHAAAEKAEQEHVISIAKLVMQLRGEEQNTAALVSHGTNRFMSSFGVVI